MNSNVLGKVNVCRSGIKVERSDSIHIQWLINLNESKRRNRSWQQNHHDWVFDRAVWNNRIFVDEDGLKHRRVCNMPIHKIQLLCRLACSNWTKCSCKIDQAESAKIFRVGNKNPRKSCKYIFMHLRVVHRESCNHVLIFCKYLPEWRMPLCQSIFNGFEFDWFSKSWLSVMH